METMLQDLRYALRVLRKNPGFTFVTVFTLALGIGATTAIFGVVYGVLLRPLPYDKPNQIVQLWEVNDRGHRMNFTDPNFEDIRSQSHSLQGLAEYGAWRGVGIGRGRTDADDGRLRLPGFLSADAGSTGVGARLSAGESSLRRRAGCLGQLRILEAASGQRDRSFCRQAHDSEPGGVGDRSAACGIPISRTSPRYGCRENSGSGCRVATAHNWQVIGRLRDGIEPDQAHAELVVIARQIKQQFGQDVDMTDVAVARLQEAMTGNVRAGLLILMGAVGFLLLIACANVANLLLAQASTREKELAIRAASWSRQRAIGAAVSDRIASAVARGRRDWRAGGAVGRDWHWFT